MTFYIQKSNKNLNMLSPKLSFFLEKTSPDPSILKLVVPRLGAIGTLSSGRMYTTSYIWTSFLPWNWVAAWPKHSLLDLEIDQVFSV